MFVHALHPTIERLAGAQTTWSGLRHELEREFLTRLLSFIPQRSMVEPQVRLEVRRLHVAQHTAPRQEAACFQGVKQQSNVETIESGQPSIKKCMVLTERLLYAQHLLFLSQNCQGA